MEGGGTNVGPKIKSAVAPQSSKDGRRHKMYLDPLGHVLPVFPFVWCPGEAHLWELVDYASTLLARCFLEGAGT